MLNIKKIIFELRNRGVDEAKIIEIEKIFEKIIFELRNHGAPENKIEEIEKAFEIACDIHKDQYRESGEPYIIHPLHVAQNLIDMEVYDADTISAALLHDTIEDAKIDFTKDDISKLINPTVAELVDGVTKISRMNFSSKNDQALANTRKIINGLVKDVRIILIKLADRKHNMETLHYKWRKPEKQIANAKETMELFVPLALTLGAYRIKNDLEDLSLKYLDPEEFKRISEKREEIEEKERPYLNTMVRNIREELDKMKISSEYIPRQLTINSIYKKTKNGIDIEDIYDLCYFKILVKEVPDCYLALYTVNKLYKPINGRIRDYICNPRTNFYQSLHTTVSDANKRFRKIKIRTQDMNKIAAFGIPAYWNIEHGRKTKEDTQGYIRQKCQFAKKLIELDSSVSDNDEFVREIYAELLTDHVYVYADSGDIIELPAGSTALDFVVEVYPTLIDKITGVVVNGKEVELNRLLKNDDRIQIKTNGKINHDNWETYANVPSNLQKLKQWKEYRNNNEE